MSARKGRFAYEGLERVMHERARLGILSCMAASGVELTFNDLKELCDLTDGNLSRHLRALEDAGIIRIRRDSKGRRPVTLVGFTREGRVRFLDYVDLLQSIVKESTGRLKTAPAS
jgi:DNA-binding transcriptional ArsR family regulator